MWRPSLPGGIAGQVVLLVFVNETAATEIYALSLHDARPIAPATSQGVLELHPKGFGFLRDPARHYAARPSDPYVPQPLRSEEHTSELQSRQYFVCRLLLEKKRRPFRLSVIPISPFPTTACAP